jgi:hypothetical protein
MLGPHPVFHGRNFVHEVPEMGWSGRVLAWSPTRPANRHGIVLGRPLRPNRFSCPGDPAMLERQVMGPIKIIGQPAGEHLQWVESGPSPRHIGMTRLRQFRTLRAPDRTAGPYLADDSLLDDPDHALEFPQSPRAHEDRESFDGRSI